jgi:cyclohexyl-isocyanide hydratase
VVEERFVQDGKIWTAAGVSAGIDMALALIADQENEEAASIVQLSSEYYPNGIRYGTEHQRSGLPAYLNA